MRPGEAGLDNLQRREEDGTSAEAKRRGPGEARQLSKAGRLIGPVRTPNRMGVQGRGSNDSNRLVCAPHTVRVDKPHEQDGCQSAGLGQSPMGGQIGLVGRVRKPEGDRRRDSHDQGFGDRPPGTSQCSPAGRGPLESPWSASRSASVRAFCDIACDNGSPGGPGRGCGTLIHCVRVYEAGTDHACEADRTHLARLRHLTGTRLDDRSNTAGLRSRGCGDQQC